MPFSNYPHGFPNGVSIQGMPVLNTYTGNVKYVSSVVGSNGNTGTFLKPYSTLSFALSQCTANNGDLILLMPGHAETVTAAAGIVLNVNGVSIVGLGQGTDRPTFTFSTSTAASMVISANDIDIQNIVGVAGIDGLLNPFNVSGDSFSMDAEWQDASSTVEATRALLLTGVAGGKINLIYRGFTAGNAVVNAIRLVGCSDIDISLFAYGIVTISWIQFLTTASTNVNITGWFYTKGITNLSRNVVDTVTGSTGFAQIVDVSAGVSASGGSATSWVLGSDDVSSIGAQVTEILNDVGPAAAASTNLYALLATGFNSTSSASNKNGSVVEMLKFMIANLVPDTQGFTASGTCDSGMTPSTTSIVCADLADYGNGFFANKYYLQVILDGVTPAAAPETEVQLITAYISSTGTFTTDAFTVTVKPSSKILVMHESVAQVGRNDANNGVSTSLVSANPIGSMLERLQSAQENISTINTNVGNPASDTLISITAKLGDPATPIGTTLSTMDATLNAVDTNVSTVSANVIATEAFVGNGSGTQMAVNKGIADALGSTGSAINDSAVSIAGMIGPNNADNAFSSANVVANPDGSLMERLEYIQTTVIGDDAAKIDSETLIASPVAGSLARFVASGGTALGTSLADSKSLLDAIGSNGTALSYDSGSTLGAIGTRFWIKKTVVSSTITFATPVDLTTVSTGGELAINQVILKTDSTGLAGATNIKILSNNANGLPVILAEAVANLGANKTVTLADASVTKIASVLESGKKFQIQATVGDGTGAGTVDVYIELIRLSAGATVAVV